MRFAKIVCTLGPSSSDCETITKLIEAGMDVARLNFSHGTHESHGILIKNIRECSKKVNRPVAILQDLQGPKLRVGKLPPEGVSLVAGQTLNLYTVGFGVEDFEGEQKSLPLDVPNLARGVKAGNRILLDDGHLELLVTDVKGETVITTVVTGGLLTSNKGVNLPGAHLGIPSFTEKDRVDLEFGLANDVDYVAISFVETSLDIEIVREAMKEINPARANTPIIAKLERPEAVKNLHDIIHVTDGVMVARGDLGVETSPALVPSIQKEIIKTANRHAKVVITATQMLESMIYNPRPTRAEASDVANAIFDGTDAVMLSGETANGMYPVETVKMMDSIVREAEKHTHEWGYAEEFPKDAIKSDALSMCAAAKELAHDRDVSNVAVFTQSGKTALLMSKIRPRVPILALSPEERTITMVNLYWGVIPMPTPYVNSLEEMVHNVDKELMDEKKVVEGEQIVLISGFPVGAMHLPNLALLHAIGEEV
ncbi:MAG: pyruvate kinase [Anaerolineae bacterium]|jgi:pyruvate kinase|nr:pyruvate kinase [Anaerolineae bacterium]